MVFILQGLSPDTGTAVQQIEKHLKDPDPVTAVLGIGEQGREMDDRHGLTDLVFPFFKCAWPGVENLLLEPAGCPCVL